MKHFVLLLALFLLVLISCGGNKQTVNDADANEIAIEQSDFDQQITEKYWKLIELEGKKVEMAENQEREVFFTLKANDNTVRGFAGCNSITGEYELEEGNRIRFTNMGITMMICPDVEVNEAEFMEVFELANNFTIHNDTLSLNVGRRAPLALFEAVYM